MDLSSKARMLEGISVFTYNLIPPPLESWSNLSGVLNPAIKKFPFKKLSSVLVSEIFKISILPLSCVAKNSDLFLTGFIFKWAKISFFPLSLRIISSVMLQTLYFLAVRSSSKLHSPALTFELPLSIWQSKTLDISFTKLLLNTLEPYLVKSNLPLLRYCALIFLELSIKKNVVFFA